MTLRYEPGVAGSYRVLGLLHTIVRRELIA
jgi:hypothetical protein